MAHFAEINQNNIVIRVIVAEQDFIDSGAVGDPKNWIQTSYNTLAGKHLSDGIPFRKNYAGVGFKYDSDADAFIPPKPFKSWTLNKETYQWDAPKKMPKNGKPHIWSEKIKNWIEQ